MAKNKVWVKWLRAILLNAKWIMLALLLLNMFGFGYLEKMTARGLGGEETFWGGVMIILLILFFVFDKVWKKICDNICNSL